MKPRIRIKYCGGCNPTYDRVALVEDVKMRLEGRVTWVSSDADPCDQVLAVHGCQTACADLSAFGGCPIHHITCREDAESFIEQAGSEGE